MYNTTHDLCLSLIFAKYFKHSTLGRKKGRDGEKEGGREGQSVGGNTKGERRGGMRGRREGGREQLSTCTLQDTRSSL
jgi:hypothetical protein